MRDGLKNNHEDPLNKLSSNRHGLKTAVRAQARIPSALRKRLNLIGPVPGFDRPGLLGRGPDLK